MIISKILSADDSGIVKELGGYRAFIETTVGRRWPGATVDWSVDGEPAQAEIHASKWVVLCPDCPEQVLYEPDEPFYCPNCQNAKNGGVARPVQSSPEIDEIVRLLCLRTMPHNRNWLAGETAEQIKIENFIHGEAI